VGEIGQIIKKGKTMALLGGNDPKFEAKAYELINEIIENKKEKIICGFYINSKYLKSEDGRYFARSKCRYLEMEKLYDYEYPIYAIKDIEEDILVECIELINPFKKG